jgi:hypothetical protein
MVFGSKIPICFICLVLVSLTGCGDGADRPALGYVTGTVTLDGEPLEGVMVMFQPEDGRPAGGLADGDGHYSIEYIKGEKGTKVGPNTVTFSWLPGDSRAKPIPPQYTAKETALKFDVKKGNNTFDLKLESDPNRPAKPLKAAD